MLSLMIFLITYTKASSVKEHCLLILPLSRSSFPALGLLGFTAYTAQVRTTEIGVRKVLGASVSSIVRLLATDFIKLVFIAIVIAAPIAWYSMHQWLQNFAYKITISWSVFALAGGMAILIAFFTISFQAVKAAVAKPVNSLRSE